MIENIIDSTAINNLLCIVEIVVINLFCIKFVKIAPNKINAVIK